MLRGAGHFMAPAAVQHVLTPVLTDVLQHGRGGIISLSFPLALWTGSTAMNTYVNTITISYGMRHVRSAVRARLVAFGLYLGALSLVWPRCRCWSPRRVDLDVAPARCCRRCGRWWPSPLPVLCRVHRAAGHAVSRGGAGARPWRRDLPGAVAATPMWLASSLLLRACCLRDRAHPPTGPRSPRDPILLFLVFQRRPGAARRRAQRRDRPAAARPRPAGAAVVCSLLRRSAAEGSVTRAAGLQTRSRRVVDVHHRVVELRPAARPPGERAEDAFSPSPRRANAAELRCRACTSARALTSAAIEFSSLADRARASAAASGTVVRGGSGPPSTSRSSMSAVIRCSRFHDCRIGLGFCRSPSPSIVLLPAGVRRPAPAPPSAGSHPPEKQGCLGFVGPPRRAEAGQAGQPCGEFPERHLRRG